MTLILKPMNQPTFTTKDCDFGIVVKLPSGDVHQVSMPSDKIREFINSTGEFKVIEDKLQGIDLK